MTDNYQNRPKEFLLELPAHKQDIILIEFYEDGSCSTYDYQWYDSCQLKDGVFAAYMSTDYGNRTIENYRYATHWIPAPVKP
jgi:hypothetical protein